MYLPPERTQTSMYIKKRTAASRRRRRRRLRPSRGFQNGETDVVRVVGNNRRGRRSSAADDAAAAAKRVRVQIIRRRRIPTSWSSRCILFLDEFSRFFFSFPPTPPSPGPHSTRTLSTPGIGVKNISCRYDSPPFKLFVSVYSYIRVYYTIIS